MKPIGKGLVLGLALAELLLLAAGCGGKGTSGHAFCGNGIVEGDEVCDDGNLMDGDGCSSNCLSDETCGNGTIDYSAGESCDDRDTIDGDGCDSECILESCGDGNLDDGEACDDGNHEDGDGCSASCGSDETCGNGIRDQAAGEECDDGNTDDGDGCSSTCRLENCGNGDLDMGEACDDGNNIGGDGCSADCLSDETCGNGITDSAAGEECDDGNTNNGDGCSSTCRNEGVNTPPVAEAGPDRTVPPGETVGLDGSGSSDADGDTLEFLWVPMGDAPALDDPMSPTPSFVAGDCGEVYTYSLTVDDGNGGQDTDEVVITVAGEGYHVSEQTCDDTDMCGSIQRPWCTIAQGLTSAENNGFDRVHVAEGEYNEAVDISISVELHGGFATDFATRDQYHLAPTVLSTEYYTVRIRQGAQARVEGFDLSLNQAAVNDQARQVVLVEDSDLILTQNFVNADVGSGPTDTSYGVYAVSSVQGRTLVIESNFLINGGNSISESAGIRSSGMNLTVTDNLLITGSSVDGYRTGISAEEGVVDIRGNTVVGMLTGAVIPPPVLSGIGISLDQCTGSIVNNPEIQGGAGSTAIGISARSGSLTISGNDRIRGVHLDELGEYAAGIVLDVVEAEISGNSSIIGGRLRSGMAIDGRISVGIDLVANTPSIAPPLVQILSNDLIRGNDGENASDSYSYGIRAWSTQLRIERNTIRAGLANNYSSYGIDVRISNQTDILRNEITGGLTHGAGNLESIGVRLENVTSFLVDANRIHATESLSATNQYPYRSIGIEVLGNDGDGLIVNNLAFGGCGMWAAGVALNENAVTVANNYLDGQGRTGGQAYGLTLASGTLPEIVIRNNILYSGGVTPASAGFYQQGPTQALYCQNNDFRPETSFVAPLYVTYGHSYFTAEEINGIDGNDTGYELNISVDPLFINHTMGDYHLQTGSLCIDAGRSDSAPDHDFDDPPTTRPQGQAVDIGPDETT